MDIYDISRWKPIKHDQYVLELGDATMTIGDPSELITKVEDLPDTRVRLVTLASVKHLSDPSEAHTEPYVMAILSTEKGVTHCFVRTDVILAHE